MGLPNNPVTLTVEQIEELNKKLSKMRHDVNNQLSMVVAAAELIRMKPASATQMVERLMDQPAKIEQTMREFSISFEAAVGITRP